MKNNKKLILLFSKILTLTLAVIFSVSATAFVNLTNPRFTGKWSCSLDGRDVTMDISTVKVNIECSTPDCQPSFFYTRARVKDRGKTSVYAIRRFDESDPTIRGRATNIMGLKNVSTGAKWLLIMENSNNRLSGYSRYNGYLYGLQCSLE